MLRMKSFKYYLIPIFFVCSCFAAVPHEERVLDYAEKTLPHSGVLKKSNGFVYVDVDDAYIHELISFIQEEGFEEPPYFGKPPLCGAHISVMYAHETDDINDVEECGETMDFTIRQCMVWHSFSGKEIYVILVDAPRLNGIRKKYGLSPDADFHITLGVKYGNHRRVS
jgi:hypothetical protein